MAGRILVDDGGRRFDGNGNPLSGAKRKAFLAGTSTAATLYTTSALSVAHANPMVANASGEFAQAWADETLLLDIKDYAADDVTFVTPLRQFLNVTPQGPSGTYTPSGSGAVSRTISAVLSDLWVSVKGFGATGDGTTDDTANINEAIATLSAGQTLFFPKGTYKVSVSDGQEKCLTSIPVGVDVYMDGEAWLKPVTTDSVTSVIVPLGRNRLKVNIDGQSLASNEVVETGTWINDSQGIRAYFSASYGQGAVDVEVYSSKFKNLRYAIQTEGARRWKIHHNHFERIKFTGALMGCSNGFSSTDNLIHDNTFENIGDTAAAFYPLVGNTTGELAYNAIANNVTKEANLLAAGCCYDIEAGSATLQHHNLIANNLYRTTRADLATQRGGIVANTLSNSLIIGNVLHGGLSSNVDYGIVSLNGKNNLISGNHCENWRGGGVNADGGTGVSVKGNRLVNCGGGDGSAHSIIMAQAYDCIECDATGNSIICETAYAHYTSGACAIGATTAATKAIRDLTISGNVIVAPVNFGIQVAGLTGTHATDINITNNALNGRSSGNFFANYALKLSYCDDVTVTGFTAMNAVNGFDVRDCADVTLKDVEMKGSTTIVVLDLFTGSTGIQVTNRRVTQTVTTVISNAGTGTVWTNCNKVVTFAYGTSSGKTTGQTIAHGLSFAPTSWWATPTAANATDVYVSADATNLTLTFGGGGTVAFAWGARV